MKNELENLESLSASIAEGFRSKRELPSTSWNEEKDRFLRAVMKNVLQLPSENQIGYYIRWYQDRIIRLTDQLYHELDDNVTCHPALNMLLDLVEEFRLTFKKDFDNSHTIPLGERLREREKITESSEKIQTNFNTAGVGQDLIAIALIPVNEFIEIDSNPITFEQYHYIREYLSELQKIDFDHSAYLKPNLTVMDLLVRLNYNQVRFLNYAISHIKRSLKEKADPQGKLAQLPEYLKMVNQVPEIKEFSYDPILPSVKSQLIRWVSEEADYLKSISPDKEEKQPALKLNLSVSQIAYLTSLFIKHGVFLEPVKAKVIRTMTGTFSSRETTRISPGSFKSKSQDPGDTAVRGVRKLLRAMAQDADEYLN